MTPKKIYEVVSVDDELPPEDKNDVGFSIVSIAIDNANSGIMGWFRLRDKAFCPSHGENEHATHWLKPTEAYTFTKEELIELLNELACSIDYKYGDKHVKEYLESKGGLK